MTDSMQLWLFILFICFLAFLTENIFNVVFLFWKIQKLALFIVIFAGMSAKQVKRMDWSPKRAIAITLWKEGYSYPEVAAQLGHGATASGVRKLFKRFEETGSVKNQSGRCRKKLTTPKTDRRMTRLGLNNRWASSNDINEELRGMGVKVSDRTVRRRLVDTGLRARIARKKPFLNVVQRQKRVAWAKEHVTSTAENWKKVRKLFLVTRQRSLSSAATAFVTFVDDLKKIAFQNAWHPPWSILSV